MAEVTEDRAAARPGLSRLVGPAQRGIGDAEPVVGERGGIAASLRRPRADAPRTARNRSPTAIASRGCPANARNQTGTQRRLVETRAPSRAAASSSSVVGGETVPANVPGEPVPDRVGECFATLRGNASSAAMPSTIAARPVPKLIRIAEETPRSVASSAARTRRRPARRGARLRPGRDGAGRVGEAREVREIRKRSRPRVPASPSTAFEERGSGAEPLGRRQPGVGALGALAGPTSHSQARGSPACCEVVGDRVRIGVWRSPAAPRPPAGARSAGAAAGCPRRAPRGSGRGRSGRGCRPARPPAGAPRPPARRRRAAPPRRAPPPRPRGRAAPPGRSRPRSPAACASPRRAGQPGRRSPGAAGAARRPGRARRASSRPRLDGAALPPPACAGARWRRRGCPRRGAPGRRRGGPRPAAPGGSARRRGRAGRPGRGGAGRAGCPSASRTSAGSCWEKGWPGLSSSTR